MSQRFYEQYKQGYFSIIKGKYLRAACDKNQETIDQLKKELFSLKSLKEWQKESLWKEITKK